MTTIQGVKFELNPTSEQLIRLGQHAGLSRVVENFCLDIYKKKLNQNKAEESYGIPKELRTVIPSSAPAMEKEWRKAHPELFPWFLESDLSSRIPKEACRVRASGISNFFKSKKGERKGVKLGFPKWRKRKDGSRFRYDGSTAKPKSATHVHLPKVGLVESRENMAWLTDRIAMGEARILGSTVRERAGRWWISFQVEVDRDELNAKRKAPEDSPECGIDLGLKTFAVIKNSDGSIEEIHAPKHLRVSLRKLKRANRKHSRRQKGSIRREKARLELAKVHLRVANQRADFLHKTTTKLARTKSAIAVENLNVKGMVKNRSLARSISDAGFGEFVRQLSYKADWYGSRVWQADRWFASSKLCSNCGFKNTELELKDREWKCPDCGVLHDRDENAATNLLKAMRQA